MGDTGESGVIGVFIIIALFACAIGLLAVFFVGLFGGFGERSKATTSVAGVLLLPILFLCALISNQLIKHEIAQSIEDKRRRPIVWAYTGNELNSLIEQFFLEHPLLFTFPNNDETPSSPKLMEYLMSKEAFRKSGFSIKDGLLFSPYGDAVLFAIDRDSNGIFTASNYVISSPWREKQYSCVLLRFTTLQEAKEQHEEWKRLN